MTAMDSIVRVREKFVEVMDLLEIESKKDPETEPYRSKYRAKAILMNMKDIITDELDTSSDDAENRLLKAMQSIILYLIGFIFVNTEEPVSGEDYFKKCYDSIPDHLDSDFLLVSLHVRNQMGILWSQRSQPSESQSWLEGAEKLYKDYKSRGKEAPKSFCDLLGGTRQTSDSEKDLETVHTYTKFYLAQVYGVQKDLLKSAIYCHETLRRQLAYNKYDHIDWALNSATLSQFFMERNLFKQARHHLAAASYILDLYEETLQSLTGDEEEIEAKKEEFKYRSSDVSRCWAKYGIFLLEDSKNKLENCAEEPPKEKCEELENLWFDNLDLTQYENQIPDTNVLLFEDAREVFLLTQKHLNKAKEYYTLEDRASDHVQIVRDHSQLFRHLTAFESDEERQFKMTKKRVTMLETVLKELNPKYYLSVCRQLWFELGETYYDMMQVKFQKVKDANEVPSPQILKKINDLAESSTNNFNTFLDSVKDKKTKELPDKLPEDIVAATLVAHFYLGRLRYKYVTQDKRKQIENTTKAYEAFKYIVDYCEKDEKAKSVVGEELSISKEMMTLLQMKILQY